MSGRVANEGRHRFLTTHDASFLGTGMRIQFLNNEGGTHTRTSGQRVHATKDACIHAEHSGTAEGRLWSAARKFRARNLSWRATKRHMPETKGSTITHGAQGSRTSTVSGARFVGNGCACRMDTELLCTKCSRSDRSWDNGNVPSRVT